VNAKVVCQGCPEEGCSGISLCNCAAVWPYRCPMGYGLDTHLRVEETRERIASIRGWRRFYTGEKSRAALGRVSGSDETSEPMARRAGRLQNSAHFKTMFSSGS